MDLAKLAKSKPTTKPLKKTARFSKEEYNHLAIQWLVGNVSQSEAMFALESDGGNTYCIIAVALKRAYQDGLLELTDLYLKDEENYPTLTLDKNKINPPTE